MIIFKKAIERYNFAINYKFSELMNTKEFIDSNFEFISIIIKKQKNDFLVEYKKATEPNSKITRSHGGLRIKRISHYYKNNKINRDNRNYLLARLDSKLLIKSSRLENCLKEKSNASKI